MISVLRLISILIKPMKYLQTLFVNSLRVALSSILILDSDSSSLLTVKLLSYYNAMWGAKSLTM